MAFLQRFDYFFDLPGELREQILSYLVIKPGGVIIGEPGEWSQNLARELGQPQKKCVRTGADSSSLCSDIDDDDEEGEENGDDDGDDEPGSRRKKSKWPLNYFLVSQTFHREVTSIFFRENTFYLLATGRMATFSRHYKAPTAAGMPFLSVNGGQNNQRHLTYARNDLHMSDANHRRWVHKRNFEESCEKLLGLARYRDSRRRIRKVVVYIKALRGRLEEDIFLPLGDMVLAGGLKHLEIRVWYFQKKSPSAFSSGPMQAMFRLLKDPDLESARLKVVADYHEDTWCPFHRALASLPPDPPGSSGRGRTGTKPSVCLSHIGMTNLGRGGVANHGGPPPGEREGGVEWLEIDVNGLARLYGKVEEALRILKVGN